MKILRSPVVILILLIVVMLISGLAAVYFAVLGTRASRRKTVAADFVTTSQLQRMFDKMGNFRKCRCLIYISVSLEKARSLYSDGKAWQIFSDIKPILLRHFAGEVNQNIALYDQKNFIALNSWSVELAKMHAEQCLEDIRQCLLKHSALNVVDIRIGSYCTMATRITFDDAIGRAKQACISAASDNVPHVEWSGRNGRAIEKKIQIENNIESEIENNNFMLACQPVVSTVSKRIVGAEILARLNSKDGLLSPASFISAVNSVGLNEKFDYYIFEKTCIWISNNRAQRERYRYTVNFSRTTLCNPFCAVNIRRIMEQYGIKPSVLSVEIMEDKAMPAAEKERMMATLRELRQIGVSILIDDFGSEYASYGDMQNLAGLVDIIKIDKSITQTIGSESGLSVFRNIVRTAKELGLRIVCEGVETKEQEAIVTDAGCDMIQGFYYYRPMPVSQFEKLCEDNAAAE